MRKRAQIKTPIVEKPQKSMREPLERKKPVKRRTFWVPFVLVSIFCVVLLLNSYFNVSADFTINPEGDDFTEKFYLAGPDPYYNMRLVEVTLETGQYPFYASDDPLINYPLGRTGGRGPLLNMMAIGFSRTLVPFMSESDAIGYAMQFVPALFGALIIFPVFFIGKTLFGTKEGLFAAFLMAIIPIHVSSGHGSAYSLFDHDSLNLLLFLLIFMFLVLSLRQKDRIQSLLFAILSGLSVAALTMVWVEARFIYAAITVYAVVQILLDVFFNRLKPQRIINIGAIMLVGYLVSLPVLLTKPGWDFFGLNLLLSLGVFALGFVMLFVQKVKIPWIISLPVLLGGGGVFIYLLQFIESLPFLEPFRRLAIIVYGSGIYGDKVDQTVAEAGTYPISRTVMSYGPALYFMAWACFFIILYFYFKQKERRDYLFIAVIFIINIWLTTTAGRFLNDLVPLVAILGGGIAVAVIAKIDYKQMIRNIRNAGGGLRGLRRGMKIYHLLGVLFIAVIIVFPNAFLAMDAAVPVAPSKNLTSNTKYDYFGEGHSGAFGQNGIPGQQKEEYWVDAFSWLNQQDLEIENPVERPGFISWWDYGFYEAAVGDHPTVADNFQTGIPPAANFHISTTEIEAVAVFITRLLEGSVHHNNGVLPEKVRLVLTEHVGENDSKNITKWVEDPESAPSFESPIGAEYDEVLSQQVRVGEQYPANAIYHDIKTLLNATLDDEGVTWLYHDIQEATGYSIRYYGVEGYDYNSIFNIFAFLADRSLVLSAFRIPGEDRYWNAEDDFQKIYYVGTEYNEKLEPVRENQQWSAEELNEMDEKNRRLIQITTTVDKRKEKFYETMVYKAFIGAPPQQDQQGNFQPAEQQLPCYFMRHFAVEYISPFPYYNSRQVAVVIAKYYEGAYINGTLTTEGEPIRFSQVVVFDQFGIPHDTMFTQEDGSFSVLVPAGNISVQFRLGQEVILDEISFNSTTDATYSPISDDEAMRRVNYTREIEVNVTKSTIEGYVYDDVNDNDTYEPDIDTPLSGVTVRARDEIFAKSDETVTTDENGYYEINDIYAGQYQITAVHNDFEIHNASVPVNPGTLNYNISNPAPASLSGAVYIDDNDNGLYDSGEERENVQVELTYTRTNEVVGTDSTDATGNYSFTGLVPGVWDYELTATIQNSTTGYNDYAFTDQISFSENESKTQEIMLELATVAVSGTVTDGTMPIEDLTILFRPDDPVENNTAVSDQSTTSIGGTYTVDLTPGVYTVTVDDSTDQGIYSYTGSIILTKGQGIRTYNIQVTKESKAITGTLTYQNTPVSNLSIDFQPDPSVENNTAEYATKQASETGQYTVELLPGTYFVIVDEEQETGGILYQYTFEGTLTVTADGTYNIALNREEIIE